MDSLPHMSDEKIQKTLDTLNEQYVAVNVFHLKPWQAWLCIGIFAGISIAVALMANRGGEVGTSEAAGVKSPFVRVKGNKLWLGNKQYFVKGVNYGGGRYIKQFDLNKDGIEKYTALAIYRNFDEQEIEKEIQFLKTQLGINSIDFRMMPSRRIAQLNTDLYGWDPWYMPDGSINPIYLERIQTFLNILNRNSIKVEMRLINNLGNYDAQCLDNGVWSKPGRCKKSLEQYTSDQVKIAPPGSPEEQFYLTALRSLIPLIKDSPAILSYDVGPESMLYWPVNGTQSSWYEPKVLSFFKRIIDEIRQLDRNHLLTSGEIVMTHENVGKSTLWYKPSPEFAEVSDVDNLNEGKPFSLYNLVDYISPHLYIGEPTDPSEVKEVIRAISVKSTKPLVWGEFGYMFPDPLSQPKTDVQREYYREVIVDSAKYGVAGYLAWIEYPVFDLKPGTYTIGPDADGKGTLLTLFGPPVRKITGYDSLRFSLWDPDLQLLPAGELYATSANLTETSPNCSKIGPKNITTSATSGTLDFYVRGVKGAVDVKFAVFSMAKGRDDVVFYSGVKQADKTSWKGTVDLANHRPGNPDYGIIRVNAWLYDAQGQKFLCDSVQFTRIAQ